MRKDGQMKIPA